MLPHIRHLVQLRVGWWWSWAGCWCWCGRRWGRPRIREPPARRILAATTHLADVAAANLRHPNPRSAALPSRAELPRLTPGTHRGACSTALCGGCHSLAVHQLSSLQVLALDVTQLALKYCHIARGFVANLASLQVTAAALSTVTSAGASPRIARSARTVAERRFHLRAGPAGGNALGCWGCSQAEPRHTPEADRQVLERGVRMVRDEDRSTLVWQGLVPSLP